MAFSSLIRFIVRTFRAEPSFVNHATNNLVDDVIELFGVLGVGILPPVVSHLRRNVPQRHEFVSNGLAQ